MLASNRCNGWWVRYCLQPSKESLRVHFEPCSQSWYRYMRLRLFNSSTLLPNCSNLEFRKLGMYLPCSNYLECRQVNLRVPCPNKRLFGSKSSKIEIWLCNFNLHLPNRLNPEPNCEPMYMQYRNLEWISLCLMIDRQTNMFEVWDGIAIDNHSIIFVSIAIYSLIPKNSQYR